MKSLFRKILVWFLSLSLTGLPVLVQAQSINNINTLGNTLEKGGSELSIGTHTAQTRTDTKPCHTKTKPVLGGKRSVKAGENAAAKASESVLLQKVKAPPSKACWCEDECQCSHSQTCQCSHSHASVAILPVSQFVFSSLTSRLVKASAVLYHDCDMDAEIIPPIV